MKTIKLFSLAILLLSGIQTMAQSDVGQIKGYIFDGDKNEPLFSATAKIMYAGNAIGATSDFNGKFLIGSVQPGTYVLEVSYLGKKKYNQKIVVKSGQIALRDTVRLYDSSGIDIDMITITADPLINPYEVSKPTITYEKLGKMAVLRNPANLLRVVGDGAFTINASTQEVYFRGSRSNGISTYLDGIKIQGAIPSVPAVSIKSYAVYTGGLPARYGDTMGGIIEIETKSYFDLWNQKMAEIGITYD